MTVLTASFSAIRLMADLAYLAAAVNLVAGVWVDGLATWGLALLGVGLGVHAHLRIDGLNEKVKS